MATPLIGSELVDVSEVTLSPGKGELQLIQEQGTLFAEVRLLASDVLGSETIPSTDAELKEAKKSKKTLSKAKNVFKFDKKTKLKKYEVLDAFYTFELEEDVESEDAPAFIVEYELRPVSKQDTITLEVVLFDKVPSLEALSVTIMNLGDEKQLTLTPSENAIQL